MKARVFTALAAIPIVLGAVFYTHPVPFLILEVLAFSIACWEFFSMIGETRRWLLTIAVATFVALSFLWLADVQGTLTFVILLIAELAAVGTIALRSRQGTKPTLYSTLMEALGWIGAPLLALALLRSVSAQAEWRLTTGLLLVLVPIWAGDIAGIFVGMTIGRHKLAPAISPNKTVEGAIGNLVFAIIFAMACGRFLHLSPWIGLTCGVLASVLGQMGDLFESWLKRRAALKDSGTLLPGHGGLLDRIDSLLFAAIPIALFLSLAVR